MATFTESRALSSIGVSLRQARVDAGHSLEHVAGALGIRSAYLEALEGGVLGRVLGPTYVESIAVRYALFIGLDPEALLISGLQGAGRDGGGDPSVSATAVPARRSRLSSEHSASGVASRPRVARVALVSAVLASLIAVVVFGGLEVGVSPPLGVSGASTADRPGSVAASAALALDLAATGGSAVGVPGESDSPLPMATTTTLGTVQNDAGAASGDSPSDGGTAQPMVSADGFVLRIGAADEAWIEVRDAASDKVLHVGPVSTGTSVILEVDGPVNVVVGKPEVLRVKIDGRAVGVPNAFRWSVTSTGVEARS